MQTIQTVLQYPVVITPKITEAKEFYVKHFGFNVVFEAEWYIQLEHTNGIEIGFMKPNLENQPKFLHQAYDGNGIIITFDVKDAEKEYKKVTETDMKVTLPYVEEEWGQKHFMIEDPTGMSIDIVQQAKNS